MFIPDESRVDLDAVSDVVVRGRYVNSRMAVVPMEPDSCAAAPADDGRITVWPSTQMPHMLRGQLAGALGWKSRELHIVTPQVGGGFGGKAGVHPEYVVVTKAARALNRPVVWVPSRSEDMRSLPHSRGQVQYAELGCKADGTFTGLRVRLIGDAGAYPGIGAFLPAGTKRMSHGTYKFPAIEFEVAIAVTNTTPMGAYRGAGRPEATALLERLVDHAAHELGIDPIELREKNFLGNEVFPFTTLTGNVYDSGNYTLPLRTAAEVVGYKERRADQAARRERGDRHLLGIGVAAYVEITAGGGGAAEFAKVEVHDDGSATMYAGTSAHGQGHQTAFAMLVSAQTGIPVDQIRLVDGDTDRVPRGGGTGGSRSLARRLGGARRHRCCAEGLGAGGDLLEADVADVVVDVDAGTVGVAGVPASALPWAELAARASEEGGEPLSGELVFEQADATFPFGAHIAVVEVDSDTGQVRLVDHIAVDDCGTVLNPLLVAGQQHGGIAAGVGQALYEEVRYNADGNPMTGNLAEYGMCRPPSPRSRCAPPRRRHRSNPLGPRASARRRRSADAGRAERCRHRRARPPRRAPHRYAVHARTGVERHARGRAGTPPDPWRAAAGVRRPSSGRGRRRRLQRRRLHLSRRVPSERARQRYRFTAQPAGPTIVRTVGVELVTSDGRRILDAAGGAVVNNIGHGRPEVVAAVAAAMAEVDYVLPTWTTPARLALADTLVERWLPSGFNHVFSPPAERGRDTAIRLARAHHVARGDTGRYKIIGRLPSYHGSTLATLAAGGHAARRSGYEPLLAEWPKAPWNDAGAVAAIIESAGPETVTAFIAEPVIGAAGGALVASADYWAGVSGVPSVRRLPSSTR
jgi:CO/xanthine dehydrogenase Mo-binding subunit